jgi:signal transduction histidine kinase
MNISTKFIGTSAFVVGLIAVVLGGSTIWRNQMEESAHMKLEQASRTIELAWKVQAVVGHEVHALKDYVLVKTQHSDIQKYQTNVLKELEELEKLMPQSPELENIRRRHEFLVRLGTQLTNLATVTSETSMADSQQDFRAINAFDRDIDFFLDELIEDSHQQKHLVEQELHQLQQVSHLLSYGIVLIILVISASQFFFILRPVIQSLHKLQVGATAIGAGDLKYRLNIQSGDEIEQVSNEFNRMADKLAESYSILVERSQELSKLNDSLESEITERKEAEAELQKILHELQQTQAQLIQTEKMSSLGQLVAGVAHEINNPVNFISGNINYVNQYTKGLLELLCLYQQEYPNPKQKIQEKAEDIELDFLIDDMPKILSSMKMGTQRIKDIVLSLRNFSRLDEAEMKAVDIHEGIDSTLLILQNRLKARPEHSAIEIIKDYGNLPLVECYPGQLNQVFMNIISNAIDALDSYNQKHSHLEINNNSSKITIRTELVNNSRVVVLIVDNGSGMTQEVKRKLFDPFFTTKPVGQGTGLGLSISYKIIVEKHAGVLRCESELGKGTEFWIEIPLCQKKHQESLHNTISL